MERKLYVWLLLAIFIGLAFSSSLHNSATSDEITHITSGYSYWTYFDYTMNPEHPPLVKLWATIPLIALDPVMPGEPNAYTGGDQWAYGKEFLYKLGNDADLIYLLTHFMMILIGAVLGYYIYLWATALFGWKAGFLALILYVFDPTFLGHTSIVHTDVPIAAAIFITTYYFWKYIEKNNSYLTFPQMIVLGILVGICLATKFTGIYIFVFLFILYFVHIYFDKFLKDKMEKDKKKSEKKEDSNRHDEFDFVGHLKSFYQYVIIRNLHLSGWWLFLTVSAISIIAVAFTYGFIHFGKFFEGLLMVIGQSADGRYGYLLGKTGTGGWWYYFIVTFFVKTPIATLVLFGAALYAFCKTSLNDHKKVRNVLFLLIPASLYFISFMLNEINIGHRHILPVYPFIFVFIGSLTVLDWNRLGDKLAKCKKYARPTLLFFVAMLIISSVFVYPYYIPFFNFLVGGPTNGHNYLLDSNIDWGQGLKETALWLEENGYDGQTIRMSYFGNELPEYRGIIANKIMCMPTPGIHVISINKLYDFAGNQYGCTDWMFDYKPVAIISYSIYIYNIDDPLLIEKDALCKLNCDEGCSTRGESYGDSAYKPNDDSCLCICAQATNEDLGIV